MIPRYLASWPVEQRALGLLLTGSKFEQAGKTGACGLACQIRTRSGEEEAYERGLCSEPLILIEDNAFVAQWALLGAMCRMVAREDVT